MFIKNIFNLTQEVSSTMGNKAMKQTRLWVTVYPVIIRWQLKGHSSDGAESACNARDPGLIPGSESSSGEGIGYALQYSWASQVAQLVKNLPVVGRPGFDCALGRSPGGGHGNPLQYSCLENPHGQRSLEGYIQSMGSQRVGHD